MPAIETHRNRCNETLKARLERQLEELAFEAYGREQSDDRYWSNGTAKAYETKAAELRMQLQQIAQDERRAA